jgi:hypothetical protein
VVEPRSVAAAGDLKVDPALALETPEHVERPVLGAAISDADPAFDAGVTAQGPDAELCCLRRVAAGDADAMQATRCSKALNSLLKLYHHGGTLAAMPSAHPRVQVTVDAELAAAMDAVDPRPTSRSRLIRDLAIRGAEAERHDRARHDEAIDYLLAIARGETTYDFECAREIHAQRESGVG